MHKIEDAGGVIYKIPKLILYFTVICLGSFCSHTALAESEQYRARVEQAQLKNQATPIKEAPILPSESEEEPAPLPEVVKTLPPAAQKPKAVETKEHADAPTPCKAKPQDLTNVPASKTKTFERRATDIKNIDTNCDGVMQAEELNNSAHEKFNEADLNKDGVISANEANVMIDNFKQSDQVSSTVTDKHAKTLKNRLDKMDADGDGVISPDEYAAYYTMRYSKQDKNKDGIIDLKEYRTDSESHHNRKRHH